MCPTQTLYTRVAEQTLILEDQFLSLCLTMSSQQDSHADGLQNNSLALRSVNMPACLTSFRAERGDFNHHTLINTDDVRTI